MSIIAETPITHIYVVGPSSTGKTTLCNALAKALNLDKEKTYITEVARSVMKQTGFDRTHVGMVEMQLAILQTQLKREKEAIIVATSSQLLTPVILSDRSAVDPIVYATLTAGQDAAEVYNRKKSLIAHSLFQEMLPQYRSSTFVLLYPIAKWLVDDGVRSMDDHDHCYEVFEELLKELDIKFSTLGESIMDLGDRVKVVLKLAGLDSAV